MGEISIVKGIYLAFDEVQAARLAKLKIFEVYKVKKLGKANENQDIGLQGKLSIDYNETSDFLNKYMNNIIKIVNG